MLTKAEITDDGGGAVRFQFNPETIKFTSTSQLDSAKTNAKSQYLGPEPITLELSMLLDEVTADESVLSRLETMMRWTRPKEDGKKTPYVVTFKWGTLKIGSSVGLKCHCKSVNVQYELFDPQGVPVRATVKVTLKEIVPGSPKNQNPTSGGELPARSRVLHAGDDLAVITHAEYGSTARWRDVAARNRVDNPFRPPLGREVVLPSDLEFGRRS